MSKPRSTKICGEEPREAGMILLSWFTLPETYRSRIESPGEWWKMVMILMIGDDVDGDGLTV